MKKKDKNKTVLDTLREADYRLDDARALFNKAAAIAEAAAQAHQLNKDRCFTTCEEVTATQVRMQKTEQAEDEAAANYKKARETRNVAYNQWLKVNSEQCDDEESLGL